ncbi:unnamed protein product [Polarella glacialis]|uniref:Transcription factor MYC/MYB N-terminal domain-containing protein n=1 Tax=Polarella glacialis TaxID=89957 RepID=A0A813F8N6_POLGL|nr:unnamed protein product [Polarella glacialis]
MAQADVEKACKESGACYAVYWCFDEAAKVLKPLAHFNPAERIAAVKAKTGKDDLFTTESYKFTMKPGEGSVGKCYASGEPLFFQDVDALPQDSFLRKDIAKQFGIVSIAMKPFGKGVLEVGSAEKWDVCVWVSSQCIRDLIV